jgi:hypothetical protein
MANTVKVPVKLELSQLIFSRFFPFKVLTFRFLFFPLGYCNFLPCIEHIPSPLRQAQGKRAGDG